MNKRTKELLVIGAMFLVAIGGYGIIQLLNSQKPIVENKKIEVRRKDEVIFTFDLSVDGTYEIEVENGHLHIEVKDRRYRVFDVDCPDKICEKVGWVKENSETLITCLPNSIVIVQPLQ